MYILYITYSQTVEIMAIEYFVLNFVLTDAMCTTITLIGFEGGFTRFDFQPRKLKSFISIGTNGVCLLIVRL